MSQHVDPARALALVALPSDDPEHVAADTHAAECTRCQHVLDESRAMLQLLDGSLAPAPISTALRGQVMERVLARPAHRRFATRLVLLAVALLSLALTLLDGRLGQPFAPVLGLRCALYESGFAVLPLAVGVLLARRGLMQFDSVRFAGTTGTFAVLGQLALRTRCEAHDVFLHLFVFHFLTVLATTLLATSIGPKMIEQRRKPL